VDVRDAHASEIDALAKLWYDAWQDAHARIVPETLTRARTRESFRERIAAMLADTRVAGLVGAPLGFCILREDELYQLFVVAAARGAGIAAALIDDAEARLAARGVETTWLTCAIGNDRAARFYEKRGWHRAGIVVDPLETSLGIIPLEVWRYEKILARRG
jgi:ribosomal protein S18 acetylase RimI-like enzyme